MKSQALVDPVSKSVVSRVPSGPLLIAGLALIGFATNSLLARAALGASRIDAAGYTVLRLASGAIGLAILQGPRPVFGGRTVGLGAGGPAKTVGSRALSGAGNTRKSVVTRWLGGAALASYAVAFSYSYLRIGAALGALVLFTTVKVSLLGWGIARGEPPRRQEGIGGVLALAGLSLLTAPGVGRPDLLGVALMFLAGASWAVYTVIGRAVQRPLDVTTANFARSVVFVLPLVPVALLAGHFSRDGVVLAILSGAIASGLSYVLWYAAVPHLTPTQAGLCQLAVPAFAVVGAVVFLGEHLSLRMMVAAATIFAGVAVALVRRR